MIISKKNLPLAQISATTLPGLNGAAPKAGFSIGGFWLNGSDAYASAADLQAALVGKELTHSRTGKSLVIVGEFTPVERDVDFVKSILTAREAYVPLESVNLADLL